MARLAKRMAGPALVTNAAADKYTVATGRRGIIRHVHVQNPSGSAVTFTMRRESAGSGVVTVTTMFEPPRPKPIHLATMLARFSSLILKVWSESS